MSKQSSSASIQATRKIFKANLLSPFIPTWPSFSDSDSKEVLQVLSRLISSHPELNKSKNVGKKNKKSSRPPIRSAFAIGLQETIKSVERDQAALVLVCKSCEPSYISHPLLLLCATRAVSAAAVKSLSLELSPLLGVKSVIAFAVLKSLQFDDVNSTVNELRPRFPPIALPCLENLKQTALKRNFVSAKICVNQGICKKMKKRK